MLTYAMHCPHPDPQARQKTYSAPRPCMQQRAIRHACPPTSSRLTRNFLQHSGGGGLKTVCWSRTTRGCIGHKTYIQSMAKDTRTSLLVEG